MAHEHNCSCGHDHDHDHDDQMDKYHEAFTKFEPVATDSKITEALQGELHTRGIKTDPRMYRPDFPDQYRYKRKHLETGR